MADINETSEEPRCGWYGGVYGPPDDAHWHCYCDLSSLREGCANAARYSSSVHLKKGEPCPLGNEDCGDTYIELNGTFNALLP